MSNYIFLYRYLFFTSKIQCTNDVESVPGTRVSTEVTFWHSAEYGSDFRRNSGEIPRNSAEFRRNWAEITSEEKKFRGIPCRRNSVDTLPGTCVGIWFRKCFRVWLLVVPNRAVFDPVEADAKDLDQYRTYLSELGTRSFFRGSLSAPHSIFSPGSLTLIRSFFEFPFSLVAQTIGVTPYLAPTARLGMNGVRSSSLWTLY